VPFVFDGVSSDNETITMTVNGGSQQNVDAGVSNVTLNGTSYSAFCVDPTHTISSGNSTTANVYNYLDPNYGFAAKSGYSTSAADAHAEAYLMSQYLTGTSLSTITAEKAADVQIAIWKIIMDGDDLSLTSGKLIVDSGTYNTSEIDSMITTAFSTTAVNTSITNVSWISNPQGAPGTQYQDFGILDTTQNQVTSTPEPGLLSLGGVFAMSAVGYGLRLRRSFRRA
jgi:hypothetical protein